MPVKGLSSVLVITPSRAHCQNCFCVVQNSFRSRQMTNAVFFFFFFSFLSLVMSATPIDCASCVVIAQLCNLPCYFAGLMSDMLQLVEFWRQIEVCRTSNFRWRYAPLCSVLARRGAGDVGFALRK